MEKKLLFTFLALVPLIIIMANVNQNMGPNSTSTTAQAIRIFEGVKCKEPGDPEFVWKSNLSKQIEDKLAGVEKSPGSYSYTVDNSDLPTCAEVYYEKLGITQENSLTARYLFGDE